ncbi:globin-1-like [Lampetra fluviatilis]
MSIADSGSAPALSGDEKAAVRDTWKVVYAHAEDHGTTVLIKFLTENADAKKFFPKFQALKTADEMKSSPVLRDHAKRIMNSINDMVVALDDTNAQNAQMNGLSKKHATDFKVDPKYFKVISNVILSVIAEGLGAQFNDAAKNGWSKLLTTTCIGLKSAF